MYNALNKNVSKPSPVKLVFLVSCLVISIQLSQDFLLYPRKLTWPPKKVPFQKVNVVFQPRFLRGHLSFGRVFYAILTAISIQKKENQRHLRVHESIISLLSGLSGWSSRINHRLTVVTCKKNLVIRVRSPGFFT